MPALPDSDLDHVVQHAAGAFKALAGARIFITGGTGFVGSWLIESLLRADVGASVVVLSRDPERYYKTNPRLAGHPALQVLQGEVLTFKFPDGQFPYVIHAATPHPPLEVDAAGVGICRYSWDTASPFYQLGGDVRQAAAGNDSYP
jgi:hypothetical protein